MSKPKAKKDDDTLKNEQPVSEVEAAEQPVAEEQVSEAVADESTENSSQLQQQLDEAQKELAEQKDMFLRKVAEFDNYKKRTQREMERIGQEGRAAAIKQLLPVFDNLARANDCAESSDEDYRKGIEIIIKQLGDNLKKAGVEEINPLNEPFDPEFHYAVSQTEDESLPENTVAAVMQIGYKLGEIVIRPAMVSVANCN